MAPAIYNWRVRSKVFRCYGELKFLEDDLSHHFDPAKLAAYRDRLDALDEEAIQPSVPLAFTDLVYTLREHVNLRAAFLIRGESPHGVFCRQSQRGFRQKHAAATNLAGYFASKRHEVMLGDIDRQQSSREWLVSGL